MDCECFLYKNKPLSDLKQKKHEVYILDKEDIKGSHIYFTDVEGNHLLFSLKNNGYYCSRFSFEEIFKKLEELEVKEFKRVF